MVDLNDLVSPTSDVVLNDVTNIGDSGEILINGLPPGCGDMDTCGHPYVLIPIGDWDEDNQARVTERERNREVASQVARAQNLTPKPQPTTSPAERVRNTMRQRLSGQRSTPRD